ncbi:hypothetical protein OCS_01470 [Ophiocordyceps sinensis CO18]|uniref:Uncharacterized protein n=1 Tax=Ophiocordyceps sinensis (strain Co18 / CGMCC 3.14243) TaxID=911162 RepID=T5ABH5_OPHSC|nr:hypothetical protein OCS_01470 [Ophiocordyceps sinensis CO18]
MTSEERPTSASTGCPTGFKYDGETGKWKCYIVSTEKGHKGQINHAANGAHLKAATNSCICTSGKHQGCAMDRSA